MDQNRGHATRVSPQVLTPEHYEVFSRAIGNVLSLDNTLSIMAQLVDGLPTLEVACSALGHLFGDGHPISQHLELCPGVLEKTRQFRESFDPSSLTFESWVVQAYQDSAHGSFAFNMRLFELLAASIQQIAVFLFQMEPNSHSKDEIEAMVNWKPPPEYYGEGQKRKLVYPEDHFDDPKFYRPTVFYHASYMDFDQYPNGLADVAGYWAEDCIFGGVILFRRGESGRESKEMYFHSGRRGRTFRIWQPLDSQISAMLDFLSADDVSRVAKSPFPMNATDLNLHRYDPWDAMARQNIFRDRWGRRIPDVKPEDRDVRSTGDYPELIGLFAKVQEAVHAAQNASSEADASFLVTSRGEGSGDTWRTPTGSPPPLDTRNYDEFYSPLPSRSASPSSQRPGISDDKVSPDCRNTGNDDRIEGDPARNESHDTNGAD